MRCFTDPAAVHASCEDYRAGAGVDDRLDAADLGRRIACPVLVLWGADGIARRAEDPLASWRPWCDDLRGHGVPGGRFSRGVPGRDAGRPARLPQGLSSTSSMARACARSRPIRRRGRSRERRRRRRSGAAAGQVAQRMATAHSPSPAWSTSRRGRRSSPGRTAQGWRWRPGRRPSASRRRPGRVEQGGQLQGGGQPGEVGGDLGGQVGDGGQPDDLGPAHLDPVRDLGQALGDRVDHQPVLDRLLGEPVSRASPSASAEALSPGERSPPSAGTRPPDPGA